MSIAMYRLPKKSSSESGKVARISKQNDRPDKGVEIDLEYMKKSGKYATVAVGRVGVMSVSYQPYSTSSKSGFPYTGHDATDEILNDVEMTSRLVQSRVMLHDLPRRERSQVRQELLDSGKLISWDEVRAQQRAKRGL